MTVTVTNTRPNSGFDPGQSQNVAISDGDALYNNTMYWGEGAIPGSSSPSPPQTQEITISGSARNTQFPILLGSERIKGDLMAIWSTSPPIPTLRLAYRLGEAPPGGLSSITNIELDGTSVSAGVTTAATGVDWIDYCAVYDGAQTQSADTHAKFGAMDWGDYDWHQRHQGTAWVAIRILLDPAPQFTTIPVLTCDYNAGSINDWDGNSRSLSNPACAAYYYMTSERFGFDASASDFNVTEWDAFADFCDATIGGENRWEVNGAVSGRSSRDILELILKHGFGTVWFWGDEWHVGYIKTHGSAAATATQDDFALNGGLKYTNVSRSKLPNRIFAWFSDQTNDRDDCRVAESKDMTPSNCRETHIRLELCTSSDMAHRWAQTYLGVMGEESRVASCTLHPGVAKNLAPYERLDITSEVDGQVSSRTWRVLSAKPKPGGFIELDLRQYSATALSASTGDDQIDFGRTGLFADVQRTRRIGDSDSGNYINVDGDGHLTLVGDATVFRSIPIEPAAASRLGFSDPDWVQLADTDGEGGSVGVYSLGFDDNTDEEVFLSVSLPTDYKEGGDIVFHVHWSPPVATAGSVEEGVTWGLEYVWVNEGDTIGNSTIVTKSDTAIFTAKEFRHVSFAGFSGTGKEIDSTLVMRLFRDVSDADDDYAHDAVLLDAAVVYEADSLGSNTATSKT